jgi:hypothetical protein
VLVHSVGASLAETMKKFVHKPEPGARLRDLYRRLGDSCSRKVGSAPCITDYHPLVAPLPSGITSATAYSTGSVRDPENVLYGFFGQDTLSAP